MRTEALDVLEGLGLGGYSGRAYLALLEGGPGTAREVWERTGVPQGRVYDVLEKLRARGLAELLPETPKRYRAVPLGDVIDKMVRESRQKADELQRRRDILVQAVAPLEAVAPEQDRALLLRGRRNVAERVRALFVEASARVAVIGTPDVARWLRTHEDVVSEARTRGVRFHVAFPIQAESRAATDVLEAMGCEVRHLLLPEFPPVGIHLAMFDHHALLARDVVAPGPGKDVASAVLLEPGGLSEGFGALAEHLWSSAVPLDERLGELDALRGVEGAMAPAAREMYEFLENLPAGGHAMVLLGQQRPAAALGACAREAARAGERLVLAGWRAPTTIPHGAEVLPSIPDAATLEGLAGRARDAGAKGVLLALDWEGAEGSAAAARERALGYRLPAGVRTVCLYTRPAALGILRREHVFEVAWGHSHVLLPAEDRPGGGVKVLRGPAMALPPSFGGEGE